MICITLNDFYYDEWFALRWMICTAMNDLYFVEWFVLRWTICTALNDLYYVEWFLLRWVICTTLNDLNYVAWFAQRWIICSTALNDLYYVEWFVLRWVTCTTLNDLNYVRCMICTALSYLFSVELFVVQYWIICTTLSDFYYVEWFFTYLQNLCDLEWFAQRWKICTTWMIRSAMDDLYNVDSFGLRWIIEYRLFGAIALSYPLPPFFIDDSGAEFHAD